VLIRGSRESDAGKSCVIKIILERNLNLRLRSVCAVYINDNVQPVKSDVLYALKLTVELLFANLPFGSVAHVFPK